MIHRHGILGCMAWLTPAALFACSQAPASSDTESASLGTASQPIIDGELAPGAEYDAIGAVAYSLPEFGFVDPFCTGTLVAPRAIVTARHCTPSIDEALANGIVPAFVIGADAFNPTQIIPITSYVTAPSAGEGEGLLLDGGRDVAVVYLEHEPTNVDPVKLGRFEEDLLGTEFTIAGYGVSDTSFSYGVRYSGTATARALKGRWYKLLFDGDYDAYLEWYFTDSSSPAPNDTEAREWWKTYRLEKDYELLAGGLPDESVGCNGDSGGPLLLRKKNGKLVTYGVSFAVENTQSSVCGLGGGYAIFNKKMLKFVKDAL